MLCSSSRRRDKAFIWSIQSVSRIEVGYQATTHSALLGVFPTYSAGTRFAQNLRYSYVEHVSEVTRSALASIYGTLAHRFVRVPTTSDSAPASLTLMHLIF